MTAKNTAPAGTDGPEDGVAEWWHAQQEWLESRSNIVEEAWHALSIAGPVAGSMAGSYPPGANTALAQDALDIAERLIAESVKRKEAALAAFDAANPEPAADEASSDD